MTEATRTVECPQDDELSVYLDGRASDEARAAIELHLADCDRCRELVADAVRLQEAPPGPNVLPFWKRARVRTIGGGTLALAAAVMLAVQVWPDWNPWRLKTPFEELAAASARRTVEGRLSGPFVHAPLATPRRSGLASEPADYRLLALRARLQERAAAQPTPDALHAVGVAHLLVGDHDQAIDALRRAEGGRASAAILNDLAAAYLARGRARNSADDLTAGIDAATRALQLEPASEAARFNRAWLLETAGRSDEATRAWQDYLALDSTSPWAAEARQR